MNGLFGAIHKEIISMKGLKELYLFGNYIAGTIPKESTQLKIFSLHHQPITPIDSMQTQQVINPPATIGATTVGATAVASTF